jgi:hypothetical protein
MGKLKHVLPLQRPVHVAHHFEGVGDNITLNPRATRSTAPETCRTYEGYS